MSDTVIGALVGGGVAAALAILGFWITYKTSTAASERAMRLQAATKKAEFRQQWIENLRNAASDYLAGASNLVDPKTKLIPTDRYEELVRRIEYIELLLNHSEKESTELIAALNKVFDKATDPGAENGAFYRARKEANAATRIILKAEWEKLKLELDDSKGK